MKVNILKFISLISGNLQIYKYDITANTWTSFGGPGKWLGNACGGTIIERRSNGHLTLMWVGGNFNVIQYMDLSKYHKSGTVSWQSQTSSHKSWQTSLVALSSHEALKLKLSF